MRTVLFLTAMLMSAVAGAKASPPADPGAVQDIRILGKLNINNATPEQLRSVPGLDPEHVDAIVTQRKAAPIADLGPLLLSAEATAHLKTNGVSDYRRIRLLPLQVVNRETAGR